MDTSPSRPKHFPDPCPICGRYVIIEPPGTGDEESCSQCGHLASSIKYGGFETLTMKLESSQASGDVLNTNRLRADAIGQLCELVSRRDGQPRVVLDLAEVKMVSSGVVGQLIALHKAVQSRAGWLRLRNVGPEMREVLRIMGLETFFEIIDP